MTRLRDAQVGTRLAAAFGLFVLLLVVMLGVGLWGSSEQSRAQGIILQHERIAQDVLQVKFRVADVNGYQNAYAFDVNQGVASATDDSVGNRKTFLASAAAFREELQAIEADDEERAQVDALGQSFDRYMALDDTIIALYRTGTPEATAQATALVLGDELEEFTAIADQTDALAEAVVEESNGAQQAGDRAADRARALMLGIGVLALVLATGLAVVITRSLTVPLRRTVDVLRAVAAGDLTVAASTTTPATRSARWAWP